MVKLQLLVLTTMVVAGALHAQENLVQNGDFNDSTGAHWSLENNGAQAKGAVSMGKYIVNIESGVSKESTPQLVQRGIELQASEGYQLSFKVSASDSGQIRVLVAGDNNQVVTDSAAGLVTVGTSVKTYSTTFFVTHSTGNGRILFNCGFSHNTTRISIDSVTLVRSVKPMIRVTEPTGDARWLSGTERQIEWQNSGALDKVKITFSPDNGTTWTVITPLASNQKSFWWQIPGDVSGEECLIVVSDTTGTAADTTAPFQIRDGGTVDAREMVRNGSFLDTTDWRFSVNSPAKAGGGIVNDEFMITIDTVGDESWQVKLEQTGFTLDNGTMYRFSFDAYASHERELFANVGADNGNPAWSVYGGDTIPVMLTTTKTRYFQTIIMKYPVSSNIRIEFNCGNDTGKVHIDNVSLIKLENSNVYIFNPSLGSILKSGARYNIEWHAEEVSTINLEFTSDSEATWAPIFEGIDNLGIVTWTVPEVSSEQCFIRIRNAANDSVLGESSQFVINAFGTPVKTGELIVNGSFANNLQGWNTSFNNAQGQALTTDEMFRINISEPGSDKSTITLSQSGIPVLKGRDYSVAFDAFANGTRSMGVKVVFENDSSTIADTVVDLPSVKQRIEMHFTAPKDVMVRLEFLMGGSRAGVFLDDVSFYTGALPLAVKAVPFAPVVGRAFAVRSAGRGAVMFANCGIAGGFVTIYTLHGQVINRLTATASEVRWNGAAAGGRHVASGSYVAVLTAPDIRQSCRFLLK